MNKLSWVSAFNDNSVSAYCSEVLLAELSEHFDLQLFSDKAGSFQGKKVRDVAELEDGLIIYQIENHPNASFARQVLLEKPGIGIFHDVQVPGEDGLLEAELKACRKVIVCTERNRSDCATLIENKELYLLPYPVTTRHCESGEFAPTNVPTRGNLYHLAFSGSVNIEHRPHKVLQALSADTKLLWLIDEKEKSDAETFLREYSVENYELITKQNIQDWQSVVEKADLAIHAHFSAFGQPEPYLSISLMAGLPAIVHNFSSTELLPSSVVLKIEPGDQETKQIREIIQSIRSQGFDNTEVLNYAQEQHSKQAILNQLLQIIG